MKSLVALLLLAGLALPATAYTGVLEGIIQYSPGVGKIGVRVSPSGRVMRVSPGSPAEIAGLAVGDKIIAADGKPGAVGRIHGDQGTAVVLTIKRGELEITRQVERVNEHLLAPYGATVAATAAQVQ